jgi:hypothetical protein
MRKNIGCRDNGEFGSVRLQGVLSLAMSSLITGTSGAFTEGLALHATTVDFQMRPPAQDGGSRRFDLT